MKISFEATVDDFVAWACYQFEHHPANQPIRKFPWAIVLIVLLINGSYLAWVAPNASPEDLMVFAFLLGLSFGCLLIRLSIYFNANNKKLVAKLQYKNYSSVSLAGFVGHRELELVETALISRSDLGENFLHLAAVQELVTMEHHTFIFLNSVTGLVIPHDRITAGDLHKFLDALEVRMSRNRV